MLLFVARALGGSARAQAPARPSTAAAEDAAHRESAAEFATQITLNVNNMWGIIKMLVDLLLDKDDGKYVIARDGLKPLVRIYAVPPNTFEGDDSEDDDEVVQEEESESD